MCNMCKCKVCRQTQCGVHSVRTTKIEFPVPRVQLCAVCGVQCAIPSARTGAFLLKGGKNHCRHTLQQITLS